MTGMIGSQIGYRESEERGRLMAEGTRLRRGSWGVTRGDTAQTRALTLNIQNDLKKSIQKEKNAQLATWLKLNVLLSIFSQHGLLQTSLVWV
jgi:hypothetical protein